MTESLSGSFYCGMEELALGGYDSNVEPSEYLRFDEELTYQNALEPSFIAMTPSTKSYPTMVTNEIMELRDDINFLKQTIKNQKDLFHEELELV